MAQLVRTLDLTAHTNLSPIWRGFAPSFVSYIKDCTRLVAASDKVSQLLAHGRWFSPGTPASSTTKTGTHSHSGQTKYLSYSTCKPNTISIMLRISLFFLCYFICIHHNLHHRPRTTLKSKCFGGSNVLLTLFRCIRIVYEPLR